MNFYKHHIGDYAAATAHLSFTEDAAYTRLLRIYYRDERPLPVEIRAVQRLAGARMPEEQEAVETVLREFFRLTDDGWHNKRCDEEIGKAQEQAATNRRIAEEREARRKSTKPDQVVHESCNESLPEREPSHKPLATSQTPEKEHKQKPAARAEPVFLNAPEWLDTDAWGEWCQYRKGKKWTPRAQALSIAKLRDLMLGGSDPPSVIRQSIAAGWTGLFPLKTSGVPNGTHRPSLVERVRANAEAGERADRGQTHRANGHANPVDPHGGDLRAPLVGDFRRIDGGE